MVKSYPRPPLAGTPPPYTPSHSLMYTHQATARNLPVIIQFLARSRAVEVGEGMVLPVTPVVEKVMAMGLSRAGSYLIPPISWMP